MPEPTYGDVHVQAALTAISVAYLQSEDNYIADKVFPVVPVVHQADKYFVYSKDDYFRDEAQLRADATESDDEFSIVTVAFEQEADGCKHVVLVLCH